MDPCGKPRSTKYLSEPKSRVVWVSGQLVDHAGLFRALENERWENGVGISRKTVSEKPGMLPLVSPSYSSKGLHASDLPLAATRSGREHTLVQQSLISYIQCSWPRKNDAADGTHEVGQCLCHAVESGTSRFWSLPTRLSGD